MILLFHVTIALVSMAYAAYAYISPSMSRLSVAGILAGTTLTSGIFLLIQNPAHMAQTCLVGLVYFSIVGTVIAAAHRKLVTI